MGCPQKPAKSSDRSCARGRWVRVAKLTRAFLWPRMGFWRLCRRSPPSWWLDTIAVFSHHFGGSRVKSPCQQGHGASRKRAAPFSCAGSGRSLAVAASLASLLPLHLVFSSGPLSFPFLSLKEYLALDSPHLGNPGRSHLETLSHSC